MFRSTRIPGIALMLALAGSMGVGTVHAAISPHGKSIVTRPIFSQEDCPVQLVYAKSSVRYLFEQVGIRNNSPSKVTAITFGVVLRMNDNMQAKPLFIAGRSIPTDLDPGQSRDIQPYALAIDQAEERLASNAGTRATAELGVIGVEFADAAPYMYDFQEEEGFRSARRPAAGPGADGNSVASALPACGASRIVLAASRNPAPEGYFSCEADPYEECILCTNNGSSCTVQECQIGYGQHDCPNCAKQVCQYHQ